MVPWPPAYLTAAGILVVLTFLRLDLALLLVPLYLPFFPAPKHVFHWQFSPSEMLIVLDCAAAVVLVLAGRARVDWRTLRAWPFLPPAIVFVLAAMASTAVAADRHVALEWLRWTVFEPLLYVGLLILFLRGSSQWLLLAVAIVGSGVVTGLIAIGQSWAATSGPAVPILNVRLQQAHAAYGSPDNLGLLYDRVLPLWLALFAAASGVRRWIRLGWLAAGLIVLLALILAYSRGAWVASTAGLLAVLAAVRPWGRWLAAAALAGVLLLAVAAGPRLAAALSTGHGGTVSKRVTIWSAAGRMVRGHPLLGIGPDNFQHYYAPTRAQDRWQHECPLGLGFVGTNAGGEPCLSHPHNEVLDFWLSTGVVGLLAFVWTEVIFWREAVRRLRDGDGDVLAFGAMGAMLAAIIHGLVDNSYFLPDLAVLFWILCGFAAHRKVAMSE